MRSAKWGTPQNSGDGVLWSPKKHIAMVADGIGGLKVGDEEWGGDGMKDIERFEDSLRSPQELTRDRIRDIFGILERNEFLGLKKAISEILLSDDDF